MKAHLITSLLLLMSSNVGLAAQNRLFFTVNAHLVDTRLDPIVNPGTCSGHVHSVYGNSAFSSDVRFSDVTNEDWQDDRGKEFLTTSNIIPNKSMYWAPSMYIFNPNDNMYYIVPSFSRAYYRIIHRNDPSVVQPFPTYLRIVMGDASRRTPWQPNEEHDDIVWTNRTWNRAGTNSSHHGDWTYLKAASRRDIGRMEELEMKIKFPSCLRIRVRTDNGPRTWASDSRSHGAYLGQDLRCPDSHPYHIPELDLEIRYQLDEIRRQLGDDVVNDTDNWILSNGDTTGASAHADFIAGWPEDLMEDIIERCRFGRSFGRGACPIQKYTGQSRAEMESKEVQFTNDVPDEVVSPVRSLPNMNDPCCIGC